MHSSIALGRLGAREDIETLYASVVGALAHGASGALPLDLRAVSFISAEGILALSTVGRLWHRRNSEPVILEHVQRQAHQYLERMNVLAQCADYICVDGALPAQHRWVRSTSSPTVCELLPIASEEAANAHDVALAITRAIHILQTWMYGDNHAVTRLCVMLAELASNITHSEDAGFAIMQRYQDRNEERNGSRITIAIADLGIGIEESLRRRISDFGDSATLRTGSDFILCALEPGVTSRNTVAGTGLPQIRACASCWRAPPKSIT